MNERLRILKMIEEGTISAQQGEELLSAMEAADGTTVRIFVE